MFDGYEWLSSQIATTGFRINMELWTELWWAGKLVDGGYLFASAFRKT